LTPLAQGGALVDQNTDFTLDFPHSTVTLSQRPYVPMVPGKNPVSSQCLRACPLRPQWTTAGSGHGRSLIARTSSSKLRAKIKTKRGGPPCATHGGEHAIAHHVATRADAPAYKDTQNQFDGSSSCGGQQPCRSRSFMRRNVTRFLMSHRIGQRLVAKQRAVDFDACRHAGIGDTARRPSPVRFVGKLLPSSAGNLTIGIVECASHAARVRITGVRRRSRSRVPAGGRRRRRPAGACRRGAAWRFLESIVSFLVWPPLDRLAETGRGPDKRQPFLRHRSRAVPRKIMRRRGPERSRLRRNGLCRRASGLACIGDAA